MRTRNKALFIAVLGLTACGLTLAYSKGLFINKSEVGGMKHPVPATTLASSVRAQGSTGGGTATAHALTGKGIKNEEALKLADTVIVGRIVDLGEPDAGSPGQIIYTNVKVEVAQTIKGSTSKATSLVLTVQKLPGEYFEETPKIGDKYILFVEGLNPKALRAKKLLEATEENVSKISALARSLGNKN